MPVYEFSCAQCGSFELWRPAADAGAALTCPSCGRTARRCFAAPGVVRTSPPLRRALAREERSAHEPEVVGAPSGRPLPWRHRH